MTGVMDRDRGSYGYLRSGVLGYFQVLQYCPKVHNLNWAFVMDWGSYGYLRSGVLGYFQVLLS